MPHFEDAAADLRMAEAAIQRNDWAMAVRHAQTCVEVSLKALLDRMNIDYAKTHPIDPDTVAKVVGAAAGKVPPDALNTAMCDIQRAGLLLNCMAPFRNTSQYGIAEGGARTIFDGTAVESLGRALTDCAGKAHRDLLLVAVRVTRAGEAPRGE